MGPGELRWAERTRSTIRPHAGRGAAAPGPTPGGLVVPLEPRPDLLKRLHRLAADPDVQVALLGDEPWIVDDRRALEAAAVGGQAVAVAADLRGGKLAVGAVASPPVDSSRFPAADWCVLRRTPGPSCYGWQGAARGTVEPVEGIAMNGTIERIDTRISVEEFEALPAYEGKRELSGAMLIREPPPGAWHGVLAARLTQRLQNWADAGGGGVVLVDAGFVLSADPPIVRSPDVAWLAEAEASRLDERAWRGAPDLAVEIVSPWDRPRDLADKVAEYLAAGVRVVWVVDPSERGITVYGRAAGVRSVGLDGELDAPDVMPGFRLATADLFWPRP